MSTKTTKSVYFSSCPSTFFENFVVRFSSGAHGPSQRFRVQDSHGKRHRFGLGERSHHAGHFPDGRSGDRQERVPVEHSGTAHLVRDPSKQGRLHRADAALRSDGGAERRDVSEGRGG